MTTDLYPFYQFVEKTSKIQFSITYSFLTTNNLITKNQSGFHPGYHLDFMGVFKVFNKVCHYDFI